MGRKFRHTGKPFTGNTDELKIDYMFTCDKHQQEHYEWECPICEMEGMLEGDDNFCFDKDCPIRDTDQ